MPAENAVHNASGQPACFCIDTVRNTKLISADHLNLTDITFSDLRVHYRTGRYYTVSGTGRNRIIGYRIGVVTDLGDLEISEWRSLMHRLIKRADEEILQNQLLEWSKAHDQWLHTSLDQEDSALESHAMRLFDNPAWQDYVAFNTVYRPDVLHYRGSEAVLSHES